MKLIKRLRNFWYRLLNRGKRFEGFTAEVVVFDKVLPDEQMCKLTDI